MGVDAHLGSWPFLGVVIEILGDPFLIKFLIMRAPGHRRQDGGQATTGDDDVAGRVDDPVAAKSSRGK
jgi:hypothetical protein